MNKKRLPDEMKELMKKGVDFQSLATSCIGSRPASFAKASDPRPNYQKRAGEFSEQKWQDILDIVEDHRTEYILKRCEDQVQPAEITSGRSCQTMH